MHVSVMSSRPGESPAEMLADCRDFRRRLLQSASRYVIRTARHVVWRCFEREVLDRATPAALVQPAEYAARVTARLAEMPPDRAESLLVAVCIALRRSPYTNKQDVGWFPEHEHDEHDARMNDGMFGNGVGADGGVWRDDDD